MDPTDSRGSERMAALASVGFGLRYDEVRLERMTTTQVAAGNALRHHVAEQLGSTAAAVEHIGSSSVDGLLAKPIVDLAVGVRGPDAPALIRQQLTDIGWIDRGDAGESGGVVLVLGEIPVYRVAYIHVVDHGGRQWRNYLQLRDLLRRNAHARMRYEATKVGLAARYPADGAAYTTGKDDIVASLLSTSTAQS